MERGNLLWLNTTKATSRGRGEVADFTALIVDPDRRFTAAVSICLERDGFRSVVVSGGREALSIFDEASPDIVLLDVALPDGSGIDVCRRLRQRSAVPIIFISAKQDEIDVVVGLEVGADDYIAKPCRFGEVMARVRASIRRVPKLGLEESVLSTGPIQLDPESHEVHIRGVRVPLPLREFQLLQFLLENAGRVVPRTGIMNEVWGVDYLGNTKTLNAHIKRLREKLEPDPRYPIHIITIHGLGYKFVQ